MQLISLKLLVVIAISTLLLITILSVIGNTYEKDILEQFFNNDKKLAVKTSLGMFLTLGLTLTICLVGMFFKFFHARAISLVTNNNTEGKMADFILNKNTILYVEKLSIILMILTFIGGIFMIFSVLKNDNILNKIINNTSQLEKQ